MRPVLICGPTAGGKSALALAIARRDGGMVVNADALQVYRCWRVLTARPDDADLAVAPHVLYGHVDCADQYSVGRWLVEVRSALVEARATGRRPVVVGGSGLYFTALTEGLAEIPPVPAEIRAEAEARSVVDLALALRGADPETWSSIDRANPTRIRRAWEVLAATGRGLRSWQAAPAGAPVVPSGTADRFVLDPPAAILAQRIERRFRAMLDGGAIDEVRSALADWDPRRPSAKALGAADLAACLRGELDLDEATRRAITATRRYAKRQRTWFRNRMRDWPRLDPEAVTAEALARLVPPT